MIFQPSDVRQCLDKAREIYDLYKQQELCGGGWWRSTDGLRDLMAKYLGKDVRVEYLDMDKNSYMATYLAVDDPGTGKQWFEIYLLNGLTEHEERFALCKELFHVLLDDADCRISDVFGHLEEVAATFPVYDSNPNRAAAWEVLAQAAAMEFMFSYAEREAFLANAKANANGGPDYSEAAARFGVPQTMVEEYCSAGHMRFFHAYR